jgi:hypothetical protein
VFHVCVHYTKELLVDLENAINKLALEADNSLSKMQDKDSEIPLVLANCATNTLKVKISFRIPRVVKGPMKKRGTTPLKRINGRKREVVKRKVLITQILSCFIHYMIV